jgi:glycosyltransferase involved in cell wall biosynthesis
MALDALGVDITLMPSSNQPPRDLERFFRPLEHRGRLGFYYDYRGRPSVMPCERVVNYSMWESTAVPRRHVQEINRAVSLQLVPSRQNLESFLQCGVRVPIEVLHHGVDETRFPVLTRPSRDTFTFGTFGDLSVRKGIDLLIRAFRDEFRAKESARLLLKSSSPADIWRVDDPRVEVQSGCVDDAALLDIMRNMDVFVLPSRGEGFGLCGLEAMSTGLPIIATAWSGPAEYLDADDSFPLRYRLVDARGARSNHVRYFGRWAEPDYEHLRALMRWMYEHPDEVKRKGLQCAARVRRDWTWRRVARQLRSYLDAVAVH